MGGIKSPLKDLYCKEGLSWISDHFPNKSFPIAAVHEFWCPEQESMAASLGFVAGLIQTLFSPDAVIAWIPSERSAFPAAFSRFNLRPHQIVCIYPGSLKERIWVIEETLKCKGFNAVIAELNGFDFTQSRRFQLAVELAGVTGFLLNSKPSPAATNACVSRWKIESIASQPAGNLPGVGFPSWQVDLEKIRNGRKGSWKICWNANRFEWIEEQSENLVDQTKKWAV